MGIVIANARSSYTPLHCLETGDPEDPARQHGQLVLAIMFSWLMMVSANAQITIIIHRHW